MSKYFSKRVVDFKRSVCKRVKRNNSNGDQGIEAMHLNKESVSHIPKGQKMGASGGTDKLRLSTTRASSSSSPLPFSSTRRPTLSSTLPFCSK